MPGSATMADTLGPSAAAESGPARAERRPAAVGSAPRSVPVASTFFTTLTAVYIASSLESAH